MAQNDNSTIDPQLIRQVAQAVDSQRSVAATFTLRSPSAKATLSPQQTSAMVRKVLNRIARQTDCKPKDVSVFPNIQSFSIDAAPSFVARLLQQPEIDSAVANEQPDDMLIKPVETREVPLHQGRKAHKQPATSPRRRIR